MKQKQLICAFLGLVLAFTACKKEVVDPIVDPETPSGPGSNRIMESLTRTFTDLGSANDYLAPAGSSVIKAPIKGGDLLIFGADRQIFYALDDTNLLDCKTLKTGSLIKFVADNKLQTVAYNYRKRFRPSSAIPETVALKMVRSLSDVVEPTFLLEFRQSRASIDSPMRASVKPVATFANGAYINRVRFEAINAGVENYTTRNAIGTVSGQFIYKTAYVYNTGTGEEVNQTAYSGSSEKDNSFFFWITAFKR